MRETLPWVALGAMGLLYGLGFAWLSVLRHAAFQSHAFDLGNMDQAVWNTLHGSLLRFTDMQLPASNTCCREPPVLTNRLAIHVEPLLIPLSLLYVLHSGPETLLVLQALVVASGVVPAYLLARGVLGRPWLSLVFPLAYVLHPSLQNAILDDFHAVTLSAALLLWAMYFLWADAMAAFWIAAVLAASTKEEVGLLIAMLGIPLAFRHRVQGLFAIAGGIAWFLVAVTVVIPHFNPGGRSPYLERYAYLGNGLRGVIAGIVRHPGLVARTLISESRLAYLQALLQPVGFVSVIALPVFLLAAPSLLINMLSQDPTMYSGFYQYSAEVVPYVVAAAILGTYAAERAAVRAWNGRLIVPVLCVLVGAASLTATRVYGFSPLADGYMVPSVGAHQRLESRLLRAVPPGSVVAAADEIEPHLSGRRTLYLLPTLHPANGPAARYIVLDASLPSLPVTPSQLHRVFGRALQAGYGVAAAKDGILVLKRGSSERRLPAAFYTFMYSTGSHVASVGAEWGPLRLIGVVVHPSYGWVNRSRPAVEVETYWRVSRRLPAGVRVRLYASEAEGGTLVDRWGYVDDSPTWDWSPFPTWPIGRTVHAALVPLVLPTDRLATVTLTLRVSGLGPVHNVEREHRVPHSSRAVVVGSIQIRP